MGFKERLKQARKNSGMTQGKLSEVSGISRESIINYENGRRTPPIDIAAKLADALGVTVGFLMDGDISIQGDWDVTRSDFEGDDLPADLEEAKRQYGEGLRHNVTTAADEPRRPPRDGDILYHYGRLNDDGKWEASKLVEMITKIPEYQSDVYKKIIAVNASQDEDKGQNTP